MEGNSEIGEYTAVEGEACDSGSNKLVVLLRRLETVEPVGVSLTGEFAEESQTVGKGVLEDSSETDADDVVGIRNICPLPMVIAVWLRGILAWTQIEGMAVADTSEDYGTPAADIPLNALDIYQDIHKGRNALELIRAELGCTS